MAAFHPTIPAQISGLPPSTPDNLIQFPAVSSLGCEITLPCACDPTGQITAVCGSVASFQCQECGWMCGACRDVIPCFSPDGQHLPILSPIPSALRSISLVRQLQLAHDAPGIIRNTELILQIIGLRKNERDDLSGIEQAAENVIFIRSSSKSALAHPALVEAYKKLADLACACTIPSGLTLDAAHALSCKHIRQLKIRRR
jgi:hypothetical protein